MIVVSDSSPIHYFILIENIDLLPALFGQIIIPQKVQEELQTPTAPESVKQWMESAPDWLKVLTAPSYIPPITLNEGERQAIAPALSLKADVILIDERKGRRIAEQAGLTVLGVPALLVAAHRKGLIGLEETVRFLQTLISGTNFRIAPEIIESLIQDLIRQHAQTEMRGTEPDK